MSIAEEGFDAAELALLHNLCNDAKYFPKIGQLSPSFVIKIIERPLYLWKEDNFHPLLVCKCVAPMPMRCKYFGDKKEVRTFECANRRIKPPPKQGELQPCNLRLYEGQYSSILERIGSRIGRPSALKKFFSPLGVRLAHHYGFSLIHHAPPFVNKQEWSLCTRLIKLSELPSVVTIDRIQELNRQMSDNPLPSIFDGFEPSDYEKNLIVFLTQSLISSRSLTLVSNVVLETPSALTGEDKLSLISDAMVNLSENALLVQNVPWAVKIGQHYDFVVRAGLDQAMQLKIIKPWETENGLSLIAVPLHGMGKTDLGWLFGSNSHIALYCDCEQFENQSSYRYSSHFDDKYLYIISTSLLRFKVFKFRDFLRESCPVQDTSKIFPVSFVANRGLFPPTSKVSIGDISQICKDTLITPEWDSDIQRHDATTSENNCSPQCLPESKRLEAMEEEYGPGLLAFKDKIIDPTSVNPFISSISMGRACDEYIIFTLEKFIKWCHDEGLIETL